MSTIEYNKLDNFGEEPPDMDHHDENAIVKQQGNLPELLRGVGALIVVAGMCSYLMEGWELWNGMSRYYVMVAGSTLLALAGLAMSYGLKENKGARVFLGLALISVLANMTTLGGFIFSAFGVPVSGALEAGILNMDWSIPEGAGLGGMLATVLLLLAPISLFAFKILNRPHATGLLVTFALSSALLLVPVRESFVVGLLILSAVIIPFIYLHKQAQENPHFKTSEGRFTVITLFAPAIIMMARLFWLYEADALIGWILCAIGFGSLRYVSITMSLSRTGQTLNNWFCGFLAIILSGLSGYLLEPVVAAELVAVLGAAVFAGLVMSMGYEQKQSRSIYRGLGLFVLVLVTGLNTLEFDTILATSTAVVVGALIFALGVVQREKIVGFWGGLLVVFALLPTLLEFIGTVDFTNWVTLAVLGITTIVIGSLVERKSRESSD